MGAGVGNNADKGKAKAQDEACESPPRKKARKGPIQYEPCGRGEFCTCAICKKAKDQQVYILMISFHFFIYLLISFGPGEPSRALKCLPGSVSQFSFLPFCLQPDSWACNKYV